MTRSVTLNCYLPQKFAAETVNRPPPLTLGKELLFASEQPRWAPSLAGFFTFSSGLGLRPQPPISRLLAVFRSLFSVPSGRAESEVRKITPIRINQLREKCDRRFYCALVGPFGGRDKDAEGRSSKAGLHGIAAAPNACKRLSGVMRHQKQLAQYRPTARGPDCPPRTRNPPRHHGTRELCGEPARRTASFTAPGP
jgi:hypothetical protein